MESLLLRTASLLVHPRHVRLDKLLDLAALDGLQPPSRLRWFDGRRGRVLSLGRVLLLLLLLWGLLTPLGSLLVLTEGVVLLGVAVALRRALAHHLAVVRLLGTMKSSVGHLLLLLRGLELSAHGIPRLARLLLLLLLLLLLGRLTLALSHLVGTTGAEHVFLVRVLGVLAHGRLLVDLGLLGDRVIEVDLAAAGVGASMLAVVRVHGCVRPGVAPALLRVVAAMDAVEICLLRGLRLLARGRRLALMVRHGRHLRGGGSLGGVL